MDVREADEVSRADALSELCEVYWYPVYGFVRRAGKESEEAKDLTQGYFADLLRRDGFAKADPDVGKMRTFLLTSLRRYLANCHSAENAQKRGGGCAVLSIDDEEAEGRYLVDPCHDLEPDQMFDRNWAQALFERAFERLREQHEASGKLETFETLKPFLAKGEGDGTYASAAKLLGQSENSIGVMVYRLRKRFRSSLETEIRNTLGSEDEFDDELQHLFSVFEG